MFRALASSRTSTHLFAVNAITPNNMTDGISHFRQRAAARQGMADEGVPTVMNRECRESFSTKNLVCRPKPFDRTAIG
jgi:hypothetical protein